jgi:enoyl-CoA hydratase/carnithine racemase
MDAIAAGVHPTIALIEGVCVGGGLEVACACDLRICGASSRFGIPINRLGLTMAHDELRALLSVVSAPVAKEILFSGELFDARRALQMNLVNRVVDDGRLEEEAYGLAAQVAAGAPRVNRWHKKFIARLADPTPLTAAELAEGYAAFDSEDFQRGYRAFLDKAAPEFEGD